MKNSWKFFKFPFEVYEIFTAFFCFWWLHLPVLFAAYVLNNFSHIFPLKSAFRQFVIFAPPSLSISHSTPLHTLFSLVFFFPHLTGASSNVIICKCFKFPNQLPLPLPLSSSHFERFQHFFIVEIKKLRFFFFFLPANCVKYGKTFV